MDFKIIWKFFPLVIVVSVILFFEISRKQQITALFNNSLNNKVIKVKNNWTGRSYDYVVDNGIVITLSKSKSLVVGDSIIKEANTGRFDVYREKNGKYEYYKSFDVGK